MWLSAFRREAVGRSVVGVTVYLLEVYLPGSSSGDLVDLGERLSEAAHAVSQDGLPVRYLRSTFVPEDETCFHYVEAPSASVAAHFAERAELLVDRILEARNVAVSTNNPREGR